MPFTQTADKVPVFFEVDVKAAKAVTKAKGKKTTKTTKAKATRTTKRVAKKAKKE